MKYVKQLLLLLSLTSCGDVGISDLPLMEETKYPCKNHPLFGVWSNEQDNVLFNNTCVGEGFYCSESFDWKPLEEGSIELFIRGTLNRPGCLHPGTYTCYYTTTTFSMTINCNGNIRRYDKEAL